MRKRMTALTGLLIGLVATSMVFASAAGEKAAPAAKAPLVLGSWGPQEIIEANNANVAEFNRLNPDISATYMNIPSVEYAQKVQSMMAAGNAPDVFLLGTDAASTWWHKGLLLNITDVVKKNDLLDAKKWYSALFSASRQGDTFYGLPDALNVFLLTYNKTLFDKYGIPYPTDDWTWDDLKKAALKMTVDANRDGVNETWGFNIWNNRYWWNQVFLWSWGAEWAIDEYEANTLPWLKGKDWKKGQLVSSGAIPALQWLQDGIFKDKFIRPRIGATIGPEAFQQGLVAMDMVGTWNLEAQIRVKDFKWDIAPIPRAKRGAPHVTQMTVSPYVVNARTKHPEQAKRLVFFMACNKFVMETMRRDTPLSKEVAFSDKYLKIPGAPDHYDLRVKIVDMVQYPRYWARQVPAFSEVALAFQTEMEKLLTNTQSASDTAANMDKEIERLIARGWQ